MYTGRVQDEESIRVNFGHPMPVFPIAGLTLLPQQVVPLHIFESRYRVMVREVLDGSGQIAMACFAGAAPVSDASKPLPLRPAVCVGHIINHEKLSGGRYNILLQGVCRAKIMREFETKQDRPYRTAQLEPVSLESADPDRLDGLREHVSDMLSEGALSKLRVADRVLEFVRNEDIPPEVLLELISFTLIEDQETRYRLLAEGRSEQRASIVERELGRLGRVLDAASRQSRDDWPKGMSWN